MKKALVSPIFQYIFVAIAGVIILFFFIRFAAQHASTSESLSSVEVVKTLDNSLDAFSISQSSDKTVDLKLNTNLYINKDTCNVISVKQANIRNKKIIFSPQQLRGRILYEWTQSWKFPFEVANFFYLSNPDYQYFLIYDQSSKLFVDNLLNERNPDSIPERFKVRAINKENIRLIDTTGNVKLIFFTTPNIKKTGSLKIIKVEPANYGQVYFYEETQKQSFFLSPEFLYGAIFAENYDSYLCSLKTALSRLILISKFYIEKANKLRIKNLNCNYNAITDSLTQIILTIENDPTTSPENLISVINIVKQNNEDLSGDDNCVALF